MRISLLLLTLIACSNAFACSEALKAYPQECQLQDRFQKLNHEFQVYAINMNELKGFKIPKAIGKSSYYSAKNELLNHSETTLPKNRDWQVWNNGQKFINQLSPIYLEYSDITKLHKYLFVGKSFFNTNTDLGKVRTNNGETNPKQSLSCAEKILNSKIFNLLDDYDLRSIEGYPLLTLKNVKACEDKNFSSADLYFYKGASVKTELVRWLTDLNDMMSRYENLTAPQEFSPYSYLSDMRRWFLAIKPFNLGNEEVVAALLDYAAKRLNLPPLSLGELSAPLYLSVAENREESLEKIQATLNFFEGCLFENKMKAISSECTSL